jgi:hypothetical protein
MQKWATFFATVLVALGVVAAANAATSESLNTGGLHLSPSQSAINKTTCRFVNPEVDYPLGRNWLAGRVYVAAEDIRHDVLMSCLRNRQDRIAKCLHKPVPSVVGKFDHGAGNPGDWKGVDALQAYLAAQSACVGAATGV